MNTGGIVVGTAGETTRAEGMARTEGNASNAAHGASAPGADAGSARLLIVEDEPKLAALMTRYLEAGGYRTTTLADGRLVVPQVRAAQPDLILLDLMLPGRDGLLDRLYEDHRVVNDRTVDTHVKNLRRKLMQVVKDRDLIHSVYGIGYKFEP